jgi:hypothetical protein
MKHSFAVAGPEPPALSGRKNAPADEDAKENIKPEVETDPITCRASDQAPHCVFPLAMYSQAGSGRVLAGWMTGSLWEFRLGAPGDCDQPFRSDGLVREEIGRHFRRPQFLPDLVPRTFRVLPFAILDLQPPCHGRHICEPIVEERTSLYYFAVSHL